MKQIIAIGFVLLYLIGMLRPMAPVIEYLSNQDYIAEFLCLEKDEPITVCKGQCYLVNKIAQENPQPEQSPIPKIDYSQYPVSPIITSSFKLLKPEIAANRHTLLSDLYSFLDTKSLFKPPIA